MSIGHIYIRVTFLIVWLRAVWNSRDGEHLGGVRNLEAVVLEGRASSSADYLHTRRQTLGLMGITHL
jgi:hypothetical protein